jgi:hypothetical protein
MVGTQEQTVIHVKGKDLILQIRDFGSSDIDIEDLLQIDTFNLLADIVTWPVIFNRISNIKADIENLLRQVKFDMSVYEAQLYEEHKKALSAEGKVTEKAIEMAVKRDPNYKIKMFQMFEVQKQVDVVDGLYWAAKSKDKKLEVISAKVKPEEFEKEILDGVINSVMIRSRQSQFPDRR